MSRSYWNANTVFVSFLAIISLGLVVAAFLVGQDYATHRMQNQEAADRHAADTGKQISEMCLSLSTAEEIARCVQSIQDTANVQRDAQQDLNAQQEMANWAFWMLVATCGVGITTVTVTAYGVFLIRDTLDATRIAAEAANEMNEIARIERRPWVTLRREVSCDFTMTEILHGEDAGDIFRYKTSLYWEYSIENVGKAPAFGIKTSQKLIAVGGAGEAEQSLIKFVNSIDTKWATRSELVVFPKEKLGKTKSTYLNLIQRSDATGTEFYLLTALAYRSQESDVTGMEAHALYIDIKPKVHGPRTARLLELTDARIVRQEDTRSRAVTETN